MSPRMLERLEYAYLVGFAWLVMSGIGFMVALVVITSSGVLGVICALMALGLAWIARDVVRTL